MKTIRSLSIILALFISIVTVTVHAKAPVKGKKWEVLFDGKNMDLWKGKNGQDFMAKGWKIEDGVLFLEERGGDILTKEKYSSFELVFEFKLTKGANSGIKYFVNTVKNKETGKTMTNGPEYQIIDDLNYKGIKDDPNGDKSSGAAYLLYAPQNKKLNPHGEWNKGKIVAKGKKVEHWLNGVKVVEYKRGSDDFLKRKAETKFKNDIDYGEQESGHIMLTDHADKVYFKNIKVRRL